MRLIAALLALLLGCAAAEGAPTIACHCFKDREFDASRPAAVDPYVLATAQNSLLSAAFGIEKSEVVRARMGGTPAEDLWIPYWVSGRTGVPRERLLEAREASGSWSGALATLRLHGTTLGPDFVQLLASKADGDALAAAAADEVVASGWKIGREEVKPLRAKGAVTGEVIVAVLIARRTGKPPAAVFSPVKAGRTTWGAALRQAGLEPRGIEAEVRRTFAK